MVGRATAGLGAAALGMLLAMRLADGSHAALVQGWYEPVLFVTAVLLLGLGIVVAVQTTQTREPWNWRVRPSSLVMVGLGAAPVLIGLLYQPAQLGSSSLETLQEDGKSSIQFSSTAAGSDGSGRNVYQWAYQFANGEPAELLGEPVDVAGFVYRGEGEAPDEFHVARFVVACCVADARGYTLPVRWTGADSLEADQWVQVTGRVGTNADGGLIVLAENVERIEAPANPYIYP